MNKLKLSGDQISVILKAAIVLALTAAVFLLVYQYDNKYTTEGPKAKNGLLILNKATLTETPVVFLVDGWEYYANRLLTPDDFSETPPTPDQYLFIGSFGGFEKWNDGNPHGSGSYRLTIRLPEQPADYTLELPEIFSAYRLYINGKPAVQMGEPSPESYYPETGNRSVTIKTGNNLEILFSVSDFSHLYSGMVYPPAFGASEAVMSLLSARLILRSLICAAVLTIGLLSVMVGLLSKKNSLALLFGLLCFCFVGYASYPLTRTLFTGFQPQYAIENVSFCAMLFVVMLLSKQICGLKSKCSQTVFFFGIVMCVAALMVNLLVDNGSLTMILWYSTLISAYEWITAGFTTACVFSALRKNTSRTAPLLYGILVFLCALVMDRLFPLYEPIVTGWFIELASFTLILFIGASTVQEVALQFRKNAVLNERANSMERLYQNQRSHLETLKQEMEKTKSMRHDMRHHLTMMEGYLKRRQFEKLSSYLTGYRLDAEYGELPNYCPIDVINVLTHHYHTIAKQNGVKLAVRCEIRALEPEKVDMLESDLCSIYSNLLENAMESCVRIPSEQRRIRVAIVRTSAEFLTIRVWNTAETVRQIKGQFFSLKKSGRIGYGLLSVKAIAEKYNGTAEFHWNVDEKEFESWVTLNV